MGWLYSPMAYESMTMPTMPETTTETDEHLIGDGRKFGTASQLSTLCLILPPFLGGIAIAFL